MNKKQFKQLHFLLASFSMAWYIAFYFFGTNIPIIFGIGLLLSVWYVVDEFTDKLTTKELKPLS